MADRTPVSSDKSPRRPKSWRNIAFGLFISLITLILCLGVMELAGYIWERNTAQASLGWTLVASRRMDMERRGSAIQPYYVLRSNQEYLWEGTSVQTNSLGFRTEEFSVLKPIDTYRILNLGDSIAFGWEVSQQDTYGKQLEQILNQAGNKLSYEVINAGVPAWNLESERNFLVQEGLDYQPDLVLLDITLVNDIYGRGPSVSETQTIFQWLRDNTFAWPFLTTNVRFLLAKQRGPEAIPVLNPPQNASAYYPLEEEDPQWDDLWTTIEDMFQASQQQGVDFVVVAFPTAFQLNDHNHPDTPQRVLGNRLNAAGIEFIDLLPVYSDICTQAELGACDGYENILFADVWMHPNKYGHKLAADYIAQRLENIIRHDD